MEAFDVKTGLENYHHYLRSKKRIEEKIEILNAKRFKVGGSIASIPEGSSSRDSMLISNGEKYERLTKELAIPTHYLNLVDEFIQWLEQPIKGLVDDKYINCLTNSEIETKYGMYKVKINREVSKSISLFVAYKNR